MSPTILSLLMGSCCHDNGDIGVGDTNRDDDGGDHDVNNFRWPA